MNSYTDLTCLEGKKEPVAFWSKNEVYKHASLEKIVKLIMLRWDINEYCKQSQRLITSELGTSKSI